MYGIVQHFDELKCVSCIGNFVKILKVLRTFNKVQSESALLRTCFQMSIRSRMHCHEFIVYTVDEFLWNFVNMCTRKIPGKNIAKRWTSVWIASLHVLMYVESLKFTIKGCFRVLMTFGILHTGHFLALVFSYKIYLFNKRQIFPRLTLIYFSEKKNTDISPEKVREPYEPCVYAYKYFLLVWISHPRQINKHL